MHSIEETSYGCKLTMGGIINHEEMIDFHTDSLKLLDTTEAEFGVLADIRNLEPMSRATQEEVFKIQRTYLKAGISRSAVIISSPVIKRQLEEIAQKTGIDKWLRYIDASATPDWERVGVAWITKAIDPDTKPKERSHA